MQNIIATNYATSFL